MTQNSNNVTQKFIEKLENFLIQLNNIEMIKKATIQMEK